MGKVKRLQGKTRHGGNAREAAAAHELSKRQQHQRREAARRLLVPVNLSHGVLRLEGGPDYIGYLEWLYKDSYDDPEACMRANDASALHVAWQYHENGVKYPFLEHKLHPFFGVYFQPTPYQHFVLLQEWLQTRPTVLSLPGATALDLGTGCGVVGFLLRSLRPLAQVLATDMNPNAVFSVQCEVQRHQQQHMEVAVADLFDGLKDRGPVDLVVFNPPWIPGEGEEQHLESGANNSTDRLDSGNYYPSDLFDRLFASAPSALRPGGHLLLLFSDYALRRGLVQESPLLRFTEATQQLKLAGVERRRVQAGARSSHRQTRRDKSWGLSLDYSVELWDFVLQG